jgi:hypothetical protein
MRRYGEKDSASDCEKQSNSETQFAHLRDSDLAPVRTHPPETPITPAGVVKVSEHQPSSAPYRRRKPESHTQLMDRDARRLPQMKLAVVTIAVDVIEPRPRPWRARLRAADRFEPASRLESGTSRGPATARPTAVAARPVAWLAPDSIRERCAA